MRTRKLPAVECPPLGRHWAPSLTTAMSCILNRPPRWRSPSPFTNEETEAGRARYLTQVQLGSDFSRDLDPGLPASAALLVRAQAVSTGLLFTSRPVDSWGPHGQSTPPSIGLPAASFRRQQASTCPLLGLPQPPAFTYNGGSDHSPAATASPGPSGAVCAWAAVTRPPTPQSPLPGPARVGVGEIAAFSGHIRRPSHRPQPSAWESSAHRPGRMKRWSPYRGPRGWGWEWEGARGTEAVGGRR